MAASQRNLVLDAFVSALTAISGPPNYFYACTPQSVSRMLRSVEQVSVFPALFVTEGSESRRWETLGGQLLTNMFELVIWGYAVADGSVALDASHAKEALIHDVDVALASALSANSFNGTIVDLIPAGTSMTVETDEGLAAVLGTPDVGVFRMRVPVIYRQTWGQP